MPAKRKDEDDEFQRMGGGKVSRGETPIALQEAVAGWFEENACLGAGDLRSTTSMQMLTLNEHKDYWTIMGRKMGRSEIMELMLDMVSSGHSIPQILSTPGMPRARTYNAWLHDYQPFAEAMEIAEHMYAMIQVQDAVDILDSSDDDKQAYRDKCRSDIRIRLGEVYNAKKFGRKQIVDVNHHNDNQTPAEMGSRFRSMLISHKAQIEELTGLQIIVPCQDAEIIPPPAEDFSEIDFSRLGMQGEGNPLEAPDRIEDEE
jgi:hypothetical protein